MKNKKLYISIMLILCLYLIIMLILYKFKIFEKNYSYVVFSDNTFLKFSNNKYTFVEKDYDELTGKKFEVYDYNKFLGNYNIKISDDTYKVYNDDYELVKFNNNFIATFSKNNKIHFNDSAIEKLDAQDYIMLKKILNTYGITKYSKLSISEKRQIRINGYDNMYVYNVSNNDYMNDDVVFSLLYISDLNNFIIIDSNIYDKDNSINSATYYIEGIMDLNNDNCDELIVNYMYFSQYAIPKKTLYEYKNNKFNIVTSTNISNK